jgi:hypothetical protein
MESTTTRELELPTLGEPGQPCEECAAPLAADQRYCVNCGHRRGGPRLPFERHVMSAASGGQPPAPASPAPQRRSSGEWSPIWAAGGLAALGVMLVIGVLLGKGSNKAPVVKVGGGLPAAASTAATPDANGLASTAPFTSDWPAGKSGYTVELGTLPKRGTTPSDVDAAKQDAQSKGASDVGALDSGDYPTLPAGNYILYSGVYDTKAEASKALGKMKGKFPDAKVVQVSQNAGGGGAGAGSTKNLTGAGSAPVKASKADLQALQSSSGASYEQQAKKLNQPIQTPGQQAPKDNKAPGGGSGAGQVIK